MKRSSDSHGTMGGEIDLVMHITGLFSDDDILVEASEVGIPQGGSVWIYTVILEYIIL